MAEPLYLVKEFSGRGCGLAAARKIRRGERILAEPAIIKLSQRDSSKQRLHKSIKEQLSKLNTDKQKAFYSLCNCRTNDFSKEIGIARTNALPLGASSSEVGIFILASRINHSCINNAQNTWNEKIQMMAIYATRDIDQGEEITIFYLHQHAGREERQRQLQDNFKFVCRCSLCSIPNPLLLKSDDRRYEMQRLDDEIGQPSRIMSDPLGALRKVSRMLDLLKQEGITDASVPRAYYDAFQIAALHRDLARSRVFAEKACSLRTELEGQDSPEVARLRKLAQDPSTHRSFGATWKWSTSLDGIPIGHDQKIFQDWLWRRDSGFLHILLT